ncbi:MAG: threonine--tRNA ligase [Malacoplasma sp.]|nr:threonine--tRNA ligase [Mycoplasmataceae bacterium]MDD7685829.1 threonine--tRNA ligase [Mycoplasmataceae bacterium]MDY2887189.1 threonine--tRNA ligase [Malacoplasma sp.]
MKINENLNRLASILLAKSIIDLYPNVIIGESTITEDGFRYSFKLPTDVKISIKDFNKIKKQMQKNIDRNYEISYESLSYEQASKLFASNPYKLALLAKDQENGIIHLGNDFVDLSANLQITKLSSIKFIELSNVSGCHFKGENSNEQLIAIDGFAFDNAKDLETFKAELQDRAERDHRKIGANLELFCFSDKIGQGLPIWLDNGTNIKFEIENYCKELMQKNEYHFVQTPVLGTTELYKISGHWDHYRENMFTPFKVENEEFVLKPMNCPHHIIVYKQKPHSYQELPYRIAEFGIQHRYESSGSLTGLERVRQMQLVDTHTVLMHEQIRDEIKKVYSMILEAHKTLGTSIYSLELSLHDPKDKAKFFDNDKMWANAEKQLREALKSLKVPFKEVIGEAAFYGPKIDMQMKTALGHIVTISTIQLDFLLPERFNLEYIDSEGKKARPVFIHAGIIGTFERYLAILLEQTKGILPFWLSPNQVIFLPVLPEKHGKFAKKLQLKLLNMGIRARIDNSNERLSKKIREAQIKKIPYQVIIGDEEMNSKNISYREYGKEESIKLPFSAFARLLKGRINKKN